MDAGSARCRRADTTVTTAHIKCHAEAKRRKGPSQCQSLFKCEYTADICLTCCLREVTAGVDVAYIEDIDVDMSVMAEAKMQRLAGALQS